MADSVHLLSYFVEHARADLLHKIVAPFERPLHRHLWSVLVLSMCLTYSTCIQLDLYDSAGAQPLVGLVGPRVVKQVPH